jgi:uncharacterized protein (TIGR01244 family)
MRNAGCLLTTLFVLLIEFGTSLGQDVTAKNFLRLNEEFCTAGQPSKEDLLKLKESGLRSILNLRRPEENPTEQAEEERLAEELGFKYFTIPVKVADLRPEQADRFLEIVKDEGNRPMLIHCMGANRVGGFWLIHRVLNDGWEFDKAEQEARKIGMTSPELVAFARSYIEQKK